MPSPSASNIIKNGLGPRSLNDGSRGSGLAFLARMIRRQVNAAADAAAADRQHHRTRKRGVGDRRQSFFDDPDRFALALMMAIRLTGDTTMLRFGSGRSDWAAARHAAALVAPGKGQRIAYSLRAVNGMIAARPTFAAGRERHDAAARRLYGKRRALSGLPAEWCELSGMCLAALNSTAKPQAKQHVRALLGILGWRAMPPSVFDRLKQILPETSKIRGLLDLSTNDETPTIADLRKRSPVIAGAGMSNMKTAATPVLNSIETTKVRLGCGRTKVLDLVKARDLDAVKLGRRTLIKEASIQQLAGRLPRVR
ncbi:hypothetical protein [Methylobacterium sp. WL103]|uniref:hypothetical protein n=1 Tax=Methylobacterium sp. WL103 TaxID=2603891 RepID=UPI001AEECC85|nr:hypothetical protein [Methylobacterium sp. WL103]